MKCENYKEQLTHWLNGQLAGIERVAFETHLSQCPECRQELGDSREVWDLMGKVRVPEPSDKMRVRFDAMLDTYKETIEEKESSFKNTGGRPGWFFRPLFQWGYTVALVMAGLFFGYLFTRQRPTAGSTKEIAALSQQVQEMKQMMLLSLLENPSASERIRAVGYTSEIRDVNKQVAEALLTTLNNDPNVNVRLLTLEALASFARDPHVREGLVQSITRQESPLVQSAMADVMVKLQEKRSIEPFRKLLLQKDLNDWVRTKIEQSISQII